jgi:lysyl-tRNA synthetase, class II
LRQVNNIYFERFLSVAQEQVAPGGQAQTSNSEIIGQPIPEVTRLLDLNEYQKLRLQKAEYLRQNGIDPYPPRFSQRTHSIADVLRHFDDWKKDDHADPPLVGQQVGVAGRLTLKRDQKVVFADLVEDGERIQIYLKDKLLEAGQQGLNLFKETVDLGDVIGVVGTPFYTKTGDRTIEVKHWYMLTKAINTPPDKYAGLQDTETRYRQRYADLLANPEVRDVFIKRSGIVREMRNFLDSRGFMEVETPAMQPLYGGAAARPFTTHYNALDQTFYLRIADELYLKRLIVGGFNKVYEICKDFRNEGVDARHSPEFTMMELYWAFADYNDIMKLTEEMIPFIAQKVLGTTKITKGAHEIELAGPYPRLRLRDAIAERSGINYDEFPTQEALYDEIARRGYKVEPDTVWPKLVDELLKQTVLPTLIQPTFLYDYPQPLSPLAKRKPEDPKTVERFQLVVGGIETTNAFSELNDPMDQLQRFVEQRKNEEAGDDEAMQMDFDFINALMYGMPPTGGIGIGIDRLCMLMLDQANIRDVILFPAMRNLQAD